MYSTKYKVIQAVIEADASTEQYYEVIQTFFRRYIRNYSEEFMSALMTSTPTNAKLHHYCTTKGGIFMAAKILGLNVEFTPPRVHLLPTIVHGDEVLAQDEQINVKAASQRPRPTIHIAAGPPPAHQLGYSNTTHTLFHKLKGDKERRELLLNLLHQFVAMACPGDTEAVMEYLQKPNIPTITLQIYFLVPGALAKAVGVLHATTSEVTINDDDDTQLAKEESISDQQKNEEEMLTGYDDSYDVPYEENINERDNEPAPETEDEKEDSAQESTPPLIETHAEEGEQQDSQSLNSTINSVTNSASSYKDINQDEATEIASTQPNANGQTSNGNNGVSNLST